MTAIARIHGHGLGCRFARDPRDYSLAKRMRTENILALPERTTAWRHGPVLDQGQTSRCTQYALAARRCAAPIACATGLQEVMEPEDFYLWAIANDEFPGEDVDGGTSVRAMCQAARHFGMASSFYTTDKLATIYQYIRRVGPVSVGTEWCESAFTPDVHGFVKQQGAVAGGHAYLLLWISSGRRPWTGQYNADDVIRFQNSWSADWGRSGFFYMLAGDFKELLEDRAGEAYDLVELGHRRTA